MDKLYISNIIRNLLCDPSCYGDLSELLVFYLGSLDSDDYEDSIALLKILVDFLEEIVHE